MSTACIIALISIVLVIVLGYFLKINYGLLGIAFAFICGVLICGMKAGAVMNMWSTKLFFQMFSITLFYAFAINNGTLELVAKKLVYATRRSTFLMPVILFIVAGVIAGIGPGTISTFLIITPLYMKMAQQAGMKPGLAVVMTACGVNAGGWSPLSVNGISLRGIMESSGYEAAAAAGFEATLFRNMFFASVIFFAIAYVIYRGWTCKAVDSEAPAAFNRQQKTSLVLIIVMTLIVVLPPILSGLFGGVFKTINSRVDATFIAVIFAVLSIILKVGDEKKAIAAVPWKTIIMVCGMGMLISVAAEAGAMTWLSDYIGSTFSASALPYIMGLVAAVMSLFSSTMGVVVPTLYPIIFAVCAASGASPAILFSIVPIAATSAGNSPFSMFGGLVQGAVEDEGVRGKLFFELIVISVVMTLVSLLLVAVGVINI